MDYFTSQIKETVSEGKKYIKGVAKEIKHECLPTESFFSMNVLRKFAAGVKDIFHIPYFPAFYRPGWFVSLIYGPKDAKFWEGLYGDIFAGFTVGMTLIPQGLSYATLAGLPPVNGLYAVIMPNICYIFLGSSMQLAVGPVALVSLLMGQLVTKYGLDASKDPEAVVNFAAEASFCVGLLMLLMGLFNLGNLIRFISYPVMSGFTTASAMIIGMNQVKNAFGFPSSANVPQTGGAVEYNYQVMQWYHEHWNDQTMKHNKWYLNRNVHATNITFGIYVPLALLWFFKTNWKPSAETKKTIAYKIFNFISSMSTLLALIISAHEAYLIHNFNDTYHAQALKVVGTVPAGLDIFFARSFDYPLRKLLVDVIPMTIIAYMEGFSVARRTAAQHGTLSLLNPSQELVALGAGNILNTVASGYPISGSFSRSCLNANCGCVTPLSAAVTVIIIIVALGTLTKAFFFIPLAALSAVVMVAVLGLLDFHEFWVAWKLSKKDFFVMITTFVLTLVYDTVVGLGVGIGLSIILLLKDLAYSLESKPISKSFYVKGIEIIRLNSNLVFVSASTIKDTLINEIFEKKHGDLQAVIMDFIDVKHADMSGLLVLQEVLDHARKCKILIFLANVLPEVQTLLTKSGVVGDDISSDCSPEIQDAVFAAQAMVGVVSTESIDVESLGMVQQLLRESKSSSLLELAQWSATKEKSVAKQAEETMIRCDVEEAVAAASSSSGDDDDADVNHCRYSNGDHIELVTMRCSSSVGNSGSIITASTTTASQPSSSTTKSRGYSFNNNNNNSIDSSSSGDSITAAAAMLSTKSSRGYSLTASTEEFHEL